MPATVSPAPDLTPIPLADNATAGAPDTTPGGSTSSLRLPSLGAVFTVLAGFVAAATVTLHLIGRSRNYSYLGAWGIDASLFPKSTDALIIYGYYGVIEQFLAVLTAILATWYLLPSAWLILFAYVNLLLAPSSGLALPAWLRPKSPQWQTVVKRLFASGFLVIATPPLIAILVLVMALPAAMGERAGKAAAVSALKDFQTGCSSSRNVCVQLLKDGQALATGFILEDSPTYIAFYDLALGRARTLPRQGLETQAMRTPKI